MSPRTQAFLLISAEKFLNGHGNGFSNMASVDHSGKEKLDGVKKIPALCLPSPTSNPWPFPKGASLKEAQEGPQKALEDNQSGTAMATPTKPLTWLELRKRLQYKLS